jgi:hypothetical protein
MSAPSVTYTFTNNSTADATQVNQNFTDIINGVSDGTKDLSINALTVAGNFTATGTSNQIGNAASDTLTVTAQVSSDVVPATDATYSFGSATKAWLAIYLSSNAFQQKLQGSASAAADTTITLPSATSTLATLALSETLTNKTLTSPNVNEAVALTTTATKLNYLTSAGGTTGTASTNIVFSASPTFTGTVAAAAGTFSSTLAVDGIVTLGASGGVTNLSNGPFRHTQTVSVTTTSATPNVANKTIVICDTSGGNVSISNFTGGASGQIFYVYKASSANTLTFLVASLFLPGALDLVLLAGGYGGAVFYTENGTNYRMIGLAKG